MTPGRIAAAFGLIAASAVLHASWNLLAKRVPSELPFVWLTSATTSVLFLPVAAIAAWVVRPVFGWQQVLFVLVSGALHTIYLLSLQRGYRDGDLSVVYPIARGTGALLAAIAAIWFLGEGTNVLSVTGIVLVVGGVFALTGGGRAMRETTFATGAEWGLLTGGAIACYTLTDRRAVTTLGVPPLVQFPLSQFVVTVLLTPSAWHRRDEVGTVWRAHRATIVLVSILAAAAYLLVLTALTFAPVTYVAPARELSIVVAVLLGARVLGEVDLRRRLLAASAVSAGVIALTVGLAT